MKKSTIFMFFLALFLIGCDLEAQQSSTYTQSKQHPETEDFQDNKQVTTEAEEQSNEQLTETLGDLTVHYIDAGQADATLFQYTSDEDNFTILYDTGDWTKTDVVDYLHAINVSSIDLIIISHPHSDHIGQLTPLIRNFNVGEVWMSGNTTSTNTFQQAVEAIMNSKTDYYEPRAGESFDIGDIEVSVIHPQQLTGELNEDSISIRISYGDVSFLFTGDAYKNEERLMMQGGENLQADFLHLGHHGSDTSNDPAFIDAVNPKYAIYSAGKDNIYGHPHPDVISYIESVDITLYGTNTHGTIVVNTDGKTYTITTENDDRPYLKITDEKTEKHQRNECIDINNATATELQQITHIGEKFAEEIINQRPFTSLEELTNIKGIGKGKLANIKKEGLACIGGK